MLYSELVTNVDKELAPGPSTSAQSASGEKTKYNLLINNLIIISYIRYSGEGDELITPVYNAPTLPPYRVCIRYLNIKWRSFQTGANLLKHTLAQAF